MSGEEREKEYLLPGERVDRLTIGNYKVIQHPEVFRFSVDAVLLATFPSLHGVKTVLDLGTGTGVIPVILAARHPRIKITGIELQPRLADMARRTVLLNGLAERIKIVEGDLRRLRQYIKEESFDLVVSNPPYLPLGTSFLNESQEMRIARHEITCTLEDIVQAAATVLKTRGRLAMVYRPERLVDLMGSLRSRRLEPKRLRFVHPRPGRPPVLVLLEAIRDARPDLKVEAPLYLQDEDGNYSEETCRLYGIEEQEEKKQ